MVATNIIICGDCLDKLKEMPKNCVDLIYADPPFYSGKDYEVFWHDGAEKRAFQDRWKGGLSHYISWMDERLRECHRVLKKNGSIFLHLDWHAVHYLKVGMDKIFGKNNFRNEIVWCYETGGRATKHFPKKHDTILWYSKTGVYNFYYDQIALPRDTSTMHEPILTDKKGRKYQRNIKFGKEYKYYLDKGILPNDWWSDIQAINPSAKERLGYPTQKPEALLERIIKTSSKKGEIILDPFCGCGTAIAVAHKLKRKWIGIDISPTACKLMLKRMKNLGVTTAIRDLPTSIKQLEKLHWGEFQNWVCEQLKGRVNTKKVGDMGIDGYMLGTIPIQVKQSHNIDRTKIDKFVGAMVTENKKKGVFVALSFTKGAIGHVDKLRMDNDINIKLFIIEDLLKADFDPMKLFK